MKMENGIKILSMWVGAIFGYAFGKMDGVFIGLIAVMGADYITGLVRAAYLKKINSRIGVKGVMKKCAILLIVAVANMADKIVLDDSTLIRTSVMFFYIANEVISIIENVGSIGVPIPGRIKKLFEQLKEENDNGDDT